MAKAIGICFFDYILVEDRGLPPEEQTIWKLRSLGTTEKEELTDLKTATGEDGQTIFYQNPLKRARKALGLGLMGWENFQGPKGPAEFKTTGEGLQRRLTDETLNLIRSEHAIELLAAILEGAQLAESTGKNS